MLWIAALLLGSGTCLAAPPLTLEQCLARALADNADLLLARQGLERSAAELRLAGASRWPSADATLFGFGRVRTGPAIRVQENPTGEVDPLTGQRLFREETTRIPATDRNAFSLSAAASYTFYDGGRRRHARQAAGAALDGAGQELQARQVEVAFAVKQAYCELLKAQELAQVEQEALKLSQKRLEETQVRLEVGAGTEAEVLRLQVALAQAQAALVEAGQDQTLAGARLNYLIGAEAGAPLELAPAEELPPLAEVPALEALVAQVRGRNPALERLRQAVRQAQAELKTAQAAWYPRLAGNLSYSRTHEVFDRVYQDFGQNYRLNLGLSLSYNLFDGGLKQASIARAHAGLEAARLTLQQQEREALLEVETARLELTRLEQLLQIAEGTVHMAGQDLRLAEELYRVGGRQGKGRLLEVLDAQVNFFAAQSNLRRTRYDLRIARANLDRLLGKW
jgi:outer membrane protein TolC